MLTLLNLEAKDTLHDQEENEEEKTNAERITATTIIHHS
jgi:hypothetical protein